MTSPTVTLTSFGQTAQAVVANPLDQFGQPFTGPVPAATFSGDNASVATVDSAGLVTAVANGTENVSGTLVTAEGVSVTGKPGVVTVAIPVATPVLTSFDVEF